MPVKGVPFLAIKKKKNHYVSPRDGSAKVLMAFGWLNAGLLAVLVVDVKGEGCRWKVCFS